MWETNACCIRWKRGVTTKCMLCQSAIKYIPAPIIICQESSTRCDFRVLLPMTSWFRLRAINPRVAITQSVDGRTRFPSGVIFAQNWRIFRPCIAQRNRARHEQLRSAPFSRMLIKSTPRQNLHWKAKINPETICHRGKRVGSPGESIILCQFPSGPFYIPRGGEGRNWKLVITGLIGVPRETESERERVT